VKQIFNLIWTVSVLACTGAVAAPLADLSGGQTDRIEFQSMNPPNRWEYARLYMQNTPKQVVWADLLMPQNVSGKVPALVLSHGSGGISPAAYDVWAKEMNAAGVAIFIIDSFTNTA
jgi:predicted dienelactone hydrolase